MKDRPRVQKYELHRSIAESVLKIKILIKVRTFQTYFHTALLNYLTVSSFRITKRSRFYRSYGCYNILTFAKKCSIRKAFLKTTLLLFTTFRKLHVHQYRFLQFAARLCPPQTVEATYSLLPQF